MLTKHLHSFLKLVAALHGHLPIVLELDLRLDLCLSRVAMLLLPHLIWRGIPLSVAHQRCESLHRRKMFQRSRSFHWGKLFSVVARESNCLFQFQLGSHLHGGFHHFFSKELIELRATVWWHLVKSLGEKCLVIVRSIRVLRNDIVEKHLARSMIAKVLFFERDNLLLARVEIEDFGGCNDALLFHLTRAFMGVL